MGKSAGISPSLKLDQYIQDNKLSGYKLMIHCNLLEIHYTNMIYCR